MNHTLITRLSAHIWATPNGKELAERIIRIAGNNYPDAARVVFLLDTDTPTLGDVCRCLSLHTNSPTSEKPYYDVDVDVSDRISIIISGPFVPSAINID